MTRTPRRAVHGGPRHLVPLALLLTVLLATGCGGEDGGNQQSATEAWADDVCSSVSDWKRAIEDSQASLADPANLSANDVRDALEGITTTTSAFVTDLKQMGPPDTESGQAAADELSTLSGRLQHQADVVAQALDESAASVPELLAQVSTVSAAVSDMVTDSLATLASIGQLDGADELESAFQDSSTCQDLGI